MDRRSQTDSGKTQEADTEMTHAKPETHTCPRAIDKTIEMIHARDMDKDTIPENAGRSNTINRLDLSRLTMTVDKIAKTQTLTAEMHKNDHNHHTKADNMTLILILDDGATIIQPSPKTWCARIAKKINHTSRECKACFKCLKIGYFRHECSAPRSSNSN